MLILSLIYVVLYSYEGSLVGTEGNYLSYTRVRFLG
jgi:hypothetical protein